MAFLATLIVAAEATPPADTYADRIAATVNASGYTLQVTSNGFTSIEMAATPEGTYAAAADVVNVKTNAPGYFLYLSTNSSVTDSNKLYLDGDPTSTHYFAATAGTHAEPAILSSNSWGYAVAGEDNFDSTYATPTPLITSKWAAVPLKGQEQLIHTATAANTDPGDDINVYYGAKANLSLPAGVYSNTVTYTAVVSGVPQDIADVSPSRLNGLNGGQTVTISTSLNAAASGVGAITVNIGEYSCTNPTASNSASGSVIITCIAPANDSGTYDVSVDLAGYSKTYYIANGIEYFKEYAPTLTDLTYMHEMTSSVCEATTTPSKTDTVVPEKVLIDVRGKDGSGTLANPATGANQQTYLVRKLADGNCWMVQNLNMTLSTSITLDSTTTDLGNAVPGRTFTPQYNTQTAEGTQWAQNGGDVARSFEPGEAMYFANGVGTGTLDTTTYNYSGYLSSGADYWHVGNYYNWYAATAGTGLAATATDGAETPVADSICPKNWKLPDNTGTKSFVNLLFTTYGLADNDANSSNKLLAAPLNFVRSGYYYWSGARVWDRGYDGAWWSSAAYAALNALYLNANSSRVVPQYGGYKGYGLSVRCVAR